ncbi:hypothetical protein L3Q82_026845 [Scortum barcoo]|uniref:Uncharacterized protein n=1 Tax=Scortum barcoo TaxID=214431 RepID=A0ACB8WKA5_9TELE|nr:hypothetical protein L3Q82_026845 [Scortum barcoo]
MQAGDRLARVEAWGRLPAGLEAGNPLAWRQAGNPLAGLETGWKPAGLETGWKPCWLGGRLESPAGLEAGWKPADQGAGWSDWGKADTEIRDPVLPVTPTPKDPPVSPGMSAEELQLILCIKKLEVRNRELEVEAMHLRSLDNRCRPYYLPREFTSVVMTAVYVPPHADNNKAMDELFGVIDRTETSRPEAHGRRLHLLQKLKRDGPVTRTIQQWSDQSDSALRDCFSTTEWCVFKDTDINTYTDAVIGYIGKCINDVVPRITVQTFPNQKPWVNGEVRAKLKARTGAYNSGDLEEYRNSSAKRQYRDKVESHYKGSNTRSMWAGLKTLTDYKKKISSAEVMSASLPDELNTFYARFESTSPAVEVQKAQEDHCPPVIIQGRRVQNS